MRVVLDTNVLVSACWTADGLEARVVRLAISGGIRPFLTVTTRMEYRNVLYREKFAARRTNVDLLLSALEAAAEKVGGAGVAEAATDPDDNRFLECAAAAEAHYLITGNLKHYPAAWGQTKIVNARQFLAERFPNLLAE
jgi:putative PIN family toxin of toxin-antitoxin system